MPTRTIANGGGNWTAGTTWVEGLAPTALDDVVATATSGNVTIDTGAVCQSADFTNYVGVLTHTNSVTWTIGSALGGALKFVAGMTYTLGGSACTIVFAATANNGGAGWPITTAGKTLPACNFSGAGGGWTAQDNWTSGDIDHTKGTLKMSGITVTATSFTTELSTARTLDISNSTLNLSGVGTSSAWYCQGGNLTLTATASTIVLSGATQTFTGNSKTYGTVRLTGTGVATITGSNTFTTLERSNAAAVTLRLTAGTTQTVTTLILAGIPGKLVTLDTTSAGSAATISIAAGTTRANHTSIKDSTVSGGATFQAYDSINVSGNTGWTFKAAKSLATAGVG